MFRSRCNLFCKRFGNLWNPQAHNCHFAIKTWMIEQSDDLLFELADRAQSNEDQAALFDSMRELRRTMRRSS